MTSCDVGCEEPAGKSRWTVDQRAELFTTLAKARNLGR